MTGHLLADGAIAVDYWRPPSNSASFHFLTHCRSLSRRLYDWRRGVVYTSQASACLLRGPLALGHLAVCVLPHGREVSLSSGTLQFTVTALDSEHCSGSVMLLFRSSQFGCVLYSGHARYSTSMLDTPALRRVIDGPGVDVLYLDNTYCSSECEFGSRQEVSDRIVELVRSWPRESPVYIGLHGLGKEELLVKLAEVLDEGIHVSRRRRAVLGITHPSPVAESATSFCTHSHQARIHVVSAWRLNSAGDRLWDHSNMPLCILPTAQHVDWPGSKPRSAGILQILPYSSHSSYSELCKFVRGVCARSVLPIVSRWQTRNSKRCGWIAERSLSARADMSVFRTFLNSASTTNISRSIPCTVGLPTESAENIESQRQQTTEYTSQSYRCSSKMDSVSRACSCETASHSNCVCDRIESGVRSSEIDSTRIEIISAGSCLLPASSAAFTTTTMSQRTVDQSGVDFSLVVDTVKHPAPAVQSDLTTSSAGLRIGSFLSSSSRTKRRGGRRWLRCLLAGRLQCPQTVLVLKNGTLRRASTALSCKVAATQAPNSDTHRGKSTAADSVLLLARVSDSNALQTVVGNVVHCSSKLA